MDNKIFGQRLRQQRKARGMTIEELAEKIGITQNYLGLVERGENLPSMATLIKIVNVLGISSDLLLCDEVRNANYLNGEIASRMEGLTPKERTAALDILDNAIKNLVSLRSES